MAADGGGGCIQGGGMTTDSWRRKAAENNPPSSTYCFCLFFQGGGFHGGGSGFAAFKSLILKAFQDGGFPPLKGGWLTRRLPSPKGFLMAAEVRHANR